MLVPLGPPAFSIRHAFDGPLGQALSLALAKRFQIQNYCPALISYINFPQSYWQMWTGSGAILMPSLVKMCLKRYMFATDRCLPDLHQKIRCRGVPGEPREWSRRGNASWTLRKFVGLCSYDHCIDAK